MADTMLDLWHGNFDQAERGLEESYREINLLGPPGDPQADSMRQVWAGQLSWLYREQGRFAELVGSDVVTAIERHGFFPVWVAGLALVHCEVGRSEDAADQVAALLVETGDLAAFPPHGWAVPTLALLAETCTGIIRSGADVSDRLDINALLARLHRLLRSARSTAAELGMSLLAHEAGQLLSESG